MLGLSQPQASKEATMLELDKEVAALAQQPTAERVKALKRIIPCATIKSILKKTGQRRACPRLPKWFMVWFVIGMGLCATDCYRQIFRWLSRFRAKLNPPRSTLCEARRRLGVAPLRWLMDGVVKLLATRKTPGAFYRRMRLMAVDGFVLDVPDTDENERAFGRPRGGRSSGAFPQVRVLGLCEIGTHVIWKCLIKPLRRAEITMLKALLRWLMPDMLLLWDRGFLSYDNVRDVRAGQANLLARLKKTNVFVRRKKLPDGSYLSKIYRSPHHRRMDRDGLEVRIIEYQIADTGRPNSGQPQRLLTTLLDPQLDPAQRLIELYHERWEIELAIKELKTHQQQRPVLRSQTPAGVIQEIYGLLLAHFVVRKLMFEAAAKHGVSPRRLSFTGTIKILRTRLADCPRSAAGRKRWYDHLLAEIAEEVLEERRDRVNPRVIKRKMSKWLKKRPIHRCYPQPTKKFRDSIRVKN
jgi:Transposase DDE domain/Insertion element 4 transposase N-terminal